MKNKKKNKLEKRTVIAIVSTGSFLLIGILALVIGFAIKDGWASVLAWFASRWAIYIYIAIAIMVFLLVWFIHKRRMEK